MILCIAPDEGMARTFSKVALEFKEKVIVEQGLLEDAVPIARRYEDEADAIVSRGGTVLVMRNAGIRTPIVELQVTAKDLATALEKARALTKKEEFRIGVMTFSNMTQQLKDFLPFFSLNLRLYELGIESNLKEAVRGAIEDGMDVLLGGVITSKVAQGSVVPSILIESGDTSIRYALEEASKIVAAIREGIIATDGEGKVFQMNGKARELLKHSLEGRAWGYGTKLPDFLMDTIQTPGLDQGSGKEKRTLVKIGAKRVMLDSIPVKVEGSVASSVITLQDIGSIQKMEEDIRREIYFKGYVAKFDFGDIVAQDPLSQRTIDLAMRYARTNASILIRGESGVGKEMFAQSVHNASDRRTGAFVAMNCAAIPETLFESELFGYVDGAFTGARKKGKPGLFEIAHGGTVFLDEISEMPLTLQARLLRVLQEHEVMRLGDDKIIPVDVRIIAASNRDLPALVASGAFRNDLFWRLNVLNLSIPPLRERRGDILPLVSHILAQTEFCGKAPRLGPGCASLLREYPWPGNVRELKNFCDRVAAICDAEEIDAGFALSLLDSGIATPKALDLPGTPEAEIAQALAEGASLGEIAQRMGIHRSTLWRRLKKSGRRPLS
ncbi:MAG: sigma-54 dependent transcription regulator [Spirochaetes bacterium]|nr:MAG: sigma-54 dependent transcription regulator [Spirochaetota bacterium]